MTTGADQGGALTEAERKSIKEALHKAGIWPVRPLLRVVERIVAARVAAERARLRAAFDAGAEWASSAEGGRPALSADFAFDLFAREGGDRG